MREFFKPWRRRSGIVVLLVAWTQYMTALVYPNWGVIIPLLLLSAYLLLVPSKTKAKAQPDREADV